MSEDWSGSLWKEQNCTSTMFSLLPVPLLSCHLHRHRWLNPSYHNEVQMPCNYSPVQVFTLTTEWFSVYKLTSFWIKGDKSFLGLLTYFSGSQLAVASKSASGFSFDEVKAKHSLRALDWVFFFLLQTICQCSKGLSCGWLKQNKNAYKRSHSEKYVLISGKNSFHSMFMNCTFKTLPRGREECFKNKMFK